MESPPPIPVLAKGFRPFFLLAALAAAVLVPLWVQRFGRDLPAPAYLPGMEGHRHEMLFGFTGAVVAGFLLTAVTNWTGRATAEGGRLLALAGLWVAGRLAVLLADSLPPGLVAAVDLAFFPALLACVGPPLWQEGDRENYFVFPVLAGLTLANLGVHLESLGWLELPPGRSTGLALDVVVVLLVLFGGRVIPYFTADALDLEEEDEPAWRTTGSVAGAAALALADLAGAPRGVLAGLAGGTAILLLVRLAGWQRRGVWGQALVWSLHLGWFWVAAGLAVRAMALGPGWIPERTATHLLTVGGIGGLTLSMMGRVALGHTGREVEAPRSLALALACVSLAALVRVGGPLLVPAYYFETLVAAAGLWSLAFGIYLVTFAPILGTPRPDGRPG